MFDIQLIFQYHDVKNLRECQLVQLIRHLVEVLNVKLRERLDVEGQN